ncbi:MAG: GNAT family N-acetyltransferase [Lentisphaeria bacterium]
MRSIVLRKFREEDVGAMNALWNAVVDEGVAFPQLEMLNLQSGGEFFASQTYTGVAEDLDQCGILGLYILHPNNVGRCGHICNASYVVKSGLRNQHIGENLVKDSIKQARLNKFRIIQFNAVVKSNKAALHLYQKLGFQPLGTIPGGFWMGKDNYVDIVPHYLCL